MVYLVNFQITDICQISHILQMTDILDKKAQRVILLKGQTKLYHQPPTSTTTLYQPKYIHHHSTPAKLYTPPPTTSQNLPTTTQNISTTINHHPPPASQDIPNTTHHCPPTDKNLFHQKPIYKNLQPLSDDNIRNPNSRPAIAKNFFYMAPSIIFTTYNRNGFKKLQCERTSQF